MSKKLGHRLKRTGLTMSVAESCTGGLLASTVTDVPGSSLYFVFGLVVYSEEQKMRELGVSRETIYNYTAVSKQAAQEMLAGLSRKQYSDICVVTTGYAGPGGGTKDDPVGTVYIGIGAPAYQEVFKCHFDGERSQVKEAAVEFVLNQLLKIISELEYR